MMMDLPENHCVPSQLLWYVYFVPSFFTDSILQELDSWKAVISYPGYRVGLACLYDMNKRLKVNRQAGLSSLGIKPGRSTGTASPMAQANVAVSEGLLCPVSLGM